MDYKTFLIIVCAVLSIVCWIGYRYFTENVYLKYKEQKVGVRTKWWRK